MQKIEDNEENISQVLECSQTQNSEEHPENDRDPVTANSKPRPKLKISLNSRLPFVSASQLASSQSEYRTEKRALQSLLLQKERAQQNVQLILPTSPPGLLIAFPSFYFLFLDFML